MAGTSVGAKKGWATRKHGSGHMQFSLSTTKMKKKPIPKSLAKKWKKNGGVNNPEYKAWIRKNWKS